MHMVLMRFAAEDGLEHLDPAQALMFWRTRDIDPHAQQIAAHVSKVLQAKHNFCDIVDRLPANYIHAVREMDPGRILERCVVIFKM